MNTFVVVGLIVAVVVIAAFVVSLVGNKKPALSDNKKSSVVLSLPNGETRCLTNKELDSFRSWCKKNKLSHVIDFMKTSEFKKPNWSDPETTRKMKLVYIAAQQWYNEYYG